MPLENAAVPSPVPSALHPEHDRRGARSDKFEPAENTVCDASADETVSEARELRVKALRDAIRNGTYHPDAGEVARKLLERGF